jgi:hypothetical protein
MLKFEVFTSTIANSETGLLINIRFFLFRKIVFMVSKFDSVWCHIVLMESNFWPKNDVILGLYICSNSV